MTYCASVSSVLALVLALSSAQASAAQDVRGPESPKTTSDAPSPAATASVTAPGAEPARGQNQLGDIVVTARRISENLQDVPVAVTAFSGETLQQQGVKTVRDVALLTPGLYIQPNPSASSAPIITIRGQVQADVVATVDPSVGTYVDGLYWARAYGANSDLLDVQSVQTLKGPQGTLFGRNTTGGAFLVQTNDPTFNGFSGLVSATYGRFNERAATGVINLPIVDDRVALRVAGSVRKRDGFYRNAPDGVRYGNVDRYTVRAKLLLKPTDNLSFLLSGELFQQDEQVQPFYLSYAAPVSFQGPVPVSGLATLAYGIGVGVDPVTAKARLDAFTAQNGSSDTSNINSRNEVFAKAQTLTGTATLDTFFGAVKLIGGYRKVQARSPIDVDGTPQTILSTGPITGRRYQQELQQYSGEFQVTGSTVNDAVDFAAGVLYFYEDGMDGSQSVALGALNPNNPNISDGFVKNESFGMYGQATWHVTDRLSVTGGLRYSIDDKAITLRNRAFSAAAGAFVCTLTGAAPAPGCEISRSDEFDGVSYTAIVDYKFSDDMLGYVKTARGFRSGGQNLRASGLSGIAFQPFQPEVATTYEAGLKSEFFDRRVRLNLAGYYTTTTNIQRATNVVAPGGGTVVNIIGNAGKQRVYGGEIELTAQVTPEFQVGGSIAVTKPKYLEYFDGIRDRRNSRFAYTPEFTATASAVYTRDLGQVGLLLRADYAHISSVDFEAANDPSLSDNQAFVNGTRSPARNIVNARAALKFGDGAYEVAIFGSNLLNDRSPVNGVYLGAPLSYTLASRGEPRTFGLTGTFKFGAR
jgi:iron complex outermembrane recepter protein